MSEGAFVRDLSIVGHVWPACNNFKGADQLSSTLLWLCLFEALVAPVIYPEGEYQGGRTTCESSGWSPDLDAYENSQIDVTMEWSNHANVLRASAEVVTRPLEEPNEGEANANVQVAVPGAQELQRRGY